MCNMCLRLEMRYALPTYLKRTILDSTESFRNAELICAPFKLYAKYLKYFDPNGLSV